MKNYKKIVMAQTKEWIKKDNRFDLYTDKHYFMIVPTFTAYVLGNDPKQPFLDGEQLDQKSFQNEQNAKDWCEKYK